MRRAALADLTEISSQIVHAAVLLEDGTVLASTIAAEDRARRLATTGLDLLAAAAEVPLQGDRELAQLEVALAEGSVFVVRDGARLVVATAAPGRARRARALRPAHVPARDRGVGRGDEPAAAQAAHRGRRRPRMRRALALLAIAGGSLLYLLRRRSGTRERVSFYYADGSMVTLNRKTIGVEKVLTLARDAF